MAVTQQFQLRESVPGMPGEYVCAGCHAPMTMAEPGSDQPAAVLTMAHDDGCAEVRRLAAGG